MASLSGQTISSTFDALLKITDNEPITSSFKEITDGLGNSSGVFLKSTGQIKLGNYTTTTSFTGTVAGYLAFTSAGEIITTAAASGGISSLNSLTASTQTFATGTSGTDFAISSSTSTHTFNLPTASATNRGALSSADWTTFNSKGNGTVTSVAALTLGTTGTDLSSSVANGTTTPVITLNVPTASATNRGVLSSTDWTTFNNKLSTAITSLNGLTGATQTFATGVTGSDFGITSTGTSHTFNIPNSSPGSRGLLSSTDFSTFNNKENALTFSAPLSRSTNTISIPAATTSVNGYLTSTDWTTFNNKQATITGGATTITTSNLTASRALVSDGSGKVAVATTTATEIGYVNGVTSAIQTQLDAKMSKTNTFNRQTASYTLVLSDANKIVEMNVATANNLTIPLNSSVAFPIGTEIQVLQYGAGQTTIVPFSVGVTLRSKSSQLKIGNQYTGVTLVKVGTDEWYVIGNVSA